MYNMYLAILLFWKKMMTNKNVLLMTLTKQMFALASKCGIVQPLSGSFNSVKRDVFSSSLFAETIL